MTTEIAPDASYIDRDKMMKATEVPFFSKDGTHEDIPCVHAAQITATAQSYEEKGGYVGIIAMVPPTGNVGMMAAYTADEVRAFAQQLERMADYIEEQNRGRAN